LRADSEGSGDRSLLSRESTATLLEVEDPGLSVDVHLLDLLPISSKSDDSGEQTTHRRRRESRDQWPWELPPCSLPQTIHFELQLESTTRGISNNY